MFILSNNWYYFAYIVSLLFGDFKAKVTIIRAEYKDPKETTMHFIVKEWSLLKVVNFVEIIQSRQGIIQGIMPSAVRGIAYMNGFVEKVMESAKTYGKSPYFGHFKTGAEGRVKYLNVILI